MTIDEMDIALANQGIKEGDDISMVYGNSNTSTNIKIRRIEKVQNGTILSAYNGSRYHSKSIKSVSKP